jgi:ElaB/YqjD/DUF883 family membrane-anchored ribosome-binding protein
MMMGRQHNSAQTERIARDAAKGMSELGRTARKRADTAKKEAVKGLNSAAASLRREAHELGASDEIRSSVDEMARGLERAAAYLRKHSYEEMGQDVTRVVRRNSFRTILIVFAVGVVIGLLIRGRNETNEQNYER